jgi:hypothetical protein
LINQVLLLLFFEPNGCDKNNLDYTKPQVGQFSKIDSSDNNIMWKDLLDSLENVPLSAHPLGNVVMVYTEIPQEFFERNAL